MSSPRRPRRRLFDIRIRFRALSRGRDHLDGNKEVNVKGEQGRRHVLRGLREQPPGDDGKLFQGLRLSPAAAVHKYRRRIVMCERRSVHQCGTCTASPDSGPNVVSPMERLHLELEMIDSGYGIFCWNERSAIPPRVPAGFLRQQHAWRWISSHQRQSAWRLPERRRVDDAPSRPFRGIFDAAGFEKATTYFPSTIRWLRASLTAPTQSRAFAAHRSTPVEELHTNGCNVECHVAKRRRYAVLPCG